MPHRARATSLREVAERAGVSTATASNALTGTRPVSEAARLAVLAAAGELGYRTNALGRALRTGRTAAVGVVVPDVTNPFFAEMLQELQQRAASRDWSTTLYDTGFDPAAEHRALEHAVDSCDGVVLMSTDPRHSRAGEVAAAGLPVVACDEPLELPGVGSVTTANRDGARAAAHHLLAAGGRAIALIGGDDRLVTAAERAAGFAAGLAEAGIELPAARVVSAALGMDGGRSGMWQLLLADPTIDAVFTTTDMQAVGALFGAIQAGRSVPDDLLLCGFDGIAWTERTLPTITTVRQDRAGMAARALDMLAAMIEGGEAGRVEQAAELVPRQSTLSPSAREPDRSS